MTPPWKVSNEAVKMIFPLPRAIIFAPMSRLSRNWALRFTSMTSNHISSGVLGGGLAFDGARVVDEDVGHAVFRHDLGGEGFHRLAVGKIALIGSEFPP